jgi:hypothetical protein
LLAVYYLATYIIIFFKNSIKNFKYKEVLWPSDLGKMVVVISTMSFFVVCTRNIIRRQYLREAEIRTLCL